MRKLNVIAVFFIFCSLISCKEKTNIVAATVVIGKGQIPNFCMDEKNMIHMTYGKGDSILYCTSSDGGKTFSSSVLVDTMQKLYSFAMRGPQIAVTNNSVCIIACNQQGNIFSYQKDAKGKWLRTSKINDSDTTAKEGFLSFGGDGENNLFAVWLDLRNQKHNNLYGAKSSDGGKSWSKNILIYNSPDGHICECCKPSVALVGSNVYVMFRNWLKGNRDLYLIQSSDGGNSFGIAQKLGKGSWQLNGCPMDGGVIAINANGIAETVWRRKNIIYACEAGKEEKQIGEGRNSTITIAGNKNVYAWVEKDEVVCLLPSGKKHQIGEGSLPVLKAVSDETVLCVWQNDNDIKATLIQL